MHSCVEIIRDCNYASTLKMGGGDGDHNMMMAPLNRGRGELTSFQGCGDQNWSGSQDQEEHLDGNINADQGITREVRQAYDGNSESDVETQKPNDFLRFFLRMGFGALMHPYEYAKVLMQLGYEPLPAIVSKNWMGRSTVFLPSIHQYIRYIKHCDGFAGLYRGLGARAISNASSAILSESLVRLVGINSMQSKTQPLKAYAWNLFRDGLIITTGLGISHPFYVISVRQMAQFVGREVVYTGITDSIRQILAKDGILGFYAGFVPRLLCDLGVLFITSTLGAICNRFLFLNSVQKEYNSALLQFGAVILLYPLQVVGACMSCSGSGIAAGAPPFMPIYCHWIDCFVDLYARRDHYRGAFIFRRTLPRMQMQRTHDAFPMSRMI